MELREAIFFWKVSVPQPNYLVQVELSREVAADPSVREVHEVYVQLR